VTPSSPSPTLPLIDLAPSFASEAGAQAVARALDAACRAHGFFYVTGHGVDAACIAAIWQANTHLFALPEAVKQRWHIERSGIQRGWDPVGWQSLDPSRPADLKESWYLGVDRGPDDPKVRAGTPNHGPNVWPDEALVPGFRAACEAYADALAGLGRHLMGLLALGLGLPREHFEPFLRDPMPVLRLLHYPPQQAAQQPGQIGSGAHTDWGGITLLLQDDAGGLQVQAADGRWFDAPPQPGSFVVNLGDLMQRWTHDRYRSNPHRVINAASGRERRSVAYFFDIDYDALVETLPTCLPADGSPSPWPSRYPPITAGAHIVEMYRRTTLAG